MSTNTDPASSTPLPVFLPRIEHAGRFAATRDVPYHSHPGPELVFVTEGSCQCEAGTGQWLPGTKGTMFILPANTPQAQRNQGFTRTTYVVFFASPDQFDSSARTIRVPNGDPVAAWMEHFCDLITHADPTDDTVARALLHATLARLVQLEHRKQAQSAFHPSLSRAIAYIDAHLTEPFAAPALARHAGVSVSHMNTLFRQHLNGSPLRYQQDRRLRLAQTLLQGPYARVNEVAATCGYEDTNYFVRLFTQRLGLSPGKWRARHANVTSAP